MARVFVSSTQKDLPDHREAVDDILRRLKADSVVMEFFGSRPDDARSVCRDEIGGCQYFIGIYAHRYGWVPPEGGGRSITEQEFDWAREQGLSTLCYVMHDDHPWPPNRVEDGDGKAKLRQFKDRIGGLVRSTFTTPDDLAKQVAADLAREIGQHAPRREAPALPRRFFAIDLWLATFFTGRIAELQKMDTALAAPGTFLALSGAGGYGKTSLATQYFKRTEARHAHVVWLFCASGVRQALLAERELQERFIKKEEQNIPDDTRWELLLQRLAAEVPGQPLLVLDNADGIAEKDGPDRCDVLELRRRLPQWSLLATLRLHKNSLLTAQLPQLPVGRLEETDARALFLDCCPAAEREDAEQLRQIFRAVGGHALLIELLAKNFQKTLEDDLPGYDLAAFCRDLSTNGILDLTKKRSVEVAWHDAEGRLDDILDRLYDFSQLDTQQTDDLGLLALLPAQPVPVQHLRRLFGIDTDDDPAVSAFTERLDRLCLHGWLQFVKAEGHHPPAYGLLPVMSELARRKIAPTMERCGAFVSRLRAILETEKLGTAKGYLDYAQAVLDSTAHLDTEEVGLLAYWAGSRSLELGQFRVALRFFEKDLAISEQIAAANPDSEDLQRGLAVSCSWLGHLALAQGKQTAARRFFEKYNTISEQIAAANPDSEGLQRELAVSCSWLGHLALAQGDQMAARRFFEKRHTISERIAAANPDSEGLQRDLAVSFRKLGDIENDTGNLAKARIFYQKALDIGEALLIINPEKEENQRDVAVFNSLLGDLALAQGDQSEARRFFEKFNTISEQIAAANPDSEELQRGLAVSYSKLGDLALAQGNQTEARRFFEKYNTIFEQIAAANPDSEELQHGLAVSCSRLGDLALAQGDQTEARRFFEKSNTISERIAAANPDSEQLQRDLAGSCVKLGDLENKMGNTESARDWWQRGLALLEQRAAINPDSAELRQDVEFTKGRLE